MTKDKLIKLELLAPAKNAEIAIAAINCGADAIYIGGPAFGARQMAGNSLDDIKRVVDYAHLFNVRVYITLNTVIKDNELNDVSSLIKKLYDIKVDALIVQDMGILMLDIPPIELHASTQCDIRTAEKAEFLEKSGFSQLVLARELTEQEINKIRNSVSVPLEAFIHGALCVCYSGRCHASEYLKGRSANRGECAQICRLPYDLYDGDGNLIKENKHLLSLKDFCQYDNLESLIRLGVTSFKIEGRLKDASYVRTVVAKYRKRLDEIISANPDVYMRSSSGLSRINFIPDLNKIFHRDFSTYFFNSRRNVNKLSTPNTPKSVGELIGTVEKSIGNRISIKTKSTLQNGDGISYYDFNGNFDGFRVNKSYGNIIETLTPIKIPFNTKLYRTYDKNYEDALEASKDSRQLALNICVKILDDTIALVCSDELGNNVTYKLHCDLVEANKSQKDTQIRILSKLGNSNYYLNEITALDNYFIPASVLTEAKRIVLDLLELEQKKNYKLTYRKNISDSPFNYIAEKLSYRDNVTNHLSEKFYKLHGVKNIEPALEISKNSDRSNVDVLMTTRYCIRRELGYCKIDNKNKELKEPLVLKNGQTNLLLDFDCKNCEMKVRTMK